MSGQTLCRPRNIVRNRVGIGLKSGFYKRDPTVYINTHSFIYMYIHIYACAYKYVHKYTYVRYALVRFCEQTHVFVAASRLLL